MDSTTALVGGVRFDGLAKLKLPGPRSTGEYSLSVVVAASPSNLWGVEGSGVSGGK